jgi:DMSO/TMAO reductase YedYZ molybdopterin-dependent catalytic subunit
MGRVLALNLLLVALVIATVIVGVVFFTGAPTKLNEVEVTEYNGEYLSSINDFRENSIQGPQHVNMTTYRLSVSGLVDRNLSLTYDDVLESFRHYQKVAKLYCVEGWNVDILWEGFLLKDLLDEAGVQTDAKGVIFYAADGYSTMLPLDYITNKCIIVAYKMNGVTLPDERGFPFQLVAESKWGYKWIKWITRIELSNNTDYLGFWESREYSNEGDISWRPP